MKCQFYTYGNRQNKGLNNKSEHGDESNNIRAPQSSDWIEKKRNFLKQLVFSRALNKYGSQAPKSHNGGFLKMLHF